MALKGIQSVLKGKKSEFRMEYPCSSPTEERWFMMTVVPLLRPDGGAVIAHRDITASKIAQEKLRLSEESLSHAQMLAKLGIWEWNISNDRVKWSDELYKILDYKQEDIIPSRNAFLERVHPDDRSLIEKSIIGLSSENKPFTLDHRIVLPNGVVKFCHSVGTLKFNERNKPAVFLGFIQDISARKLNEDAFRKSESRLAEAQRIASLGSWEWDKITNKVTWSDEIFNILGLDPENYEVTHDLFLDLVHPNDRENVENLIDQAIANPNKEYSAQYRIIRPDGIERTLIGRSESKKNDNNNPDRLVGTMQDITEIKKIELETLQLRNEMARLERVGTIGNLASAIAHEINQPLASIVTNSQAALRMLNNNPSKLDEVQEALNDIAEAGKRAGEIIRSVRNLIKKEDLKCESFNINNIVKEIEGFVRSELIIQNISLTTDLNPQCPVLYGDRIQIQQVILNLVMNAIDALKDHPDYNRRIKILTKVIDNEGVKVTVEDSGPGIDQKQIKNMFTSFYTTKTKGLGLGLSVCMSVIKNHGGRIWTENSPGAGAKFSFLLPFNKDSD